MAKRIEITPALGCSTTISRHGALVVAAVFELAYSEDCIFHVDLWTNARDQVSSDGSWHWIPFSIVPDCCQDDPEDPTKNSLRMRFECRVLPCAKGRFEFTVRYTYGIRHVASEQKVETVIVERWAGRFGDNGVCVVV